MRLVTLRRFAFVAVIAVMEPLWGHWAALPRLVVEASTETVPAHAEIGTAAIPSFRQHVEAAWRGSKEQPATSRSVMALAVLAVLSLLRPTPWRTLVTARPAPPALARRRHVIALRAPPAPRCV